MSFPPNQRTASPAVDLSILTSFESIQTGGEPDLVVELIDLYLADVPCRFALMRQGIAKRDQTAIRREAHNLKGSSANLGILQMASICDLVERLDLIPTSPSLQELLGCLEREFSRVRLLLLEERRKRLQ